MPIGTDTSVQVERPGKNGSTNTGVTEVQIVRALFRAPGTDPPLLRHTHYPLPRRLWAPTAHMVSSSLTLHFVFLFDFGKRTPLW